MGEHRVHDTTDEQRTRAYVRALLDDIRALEVMIEKGLIESDIQRVGVEQEMYIVNSQDYPAPISDRVLKNIGDQRFSTELARFNLEANLDPCPIGGDFLRDMESNLKAGNQSIPADLDDLEYGLSITDGCIDWETTETCLREMRDRIREILPRRM